MKTQAGIKKTENVETVQNYRLWGNVGELHNLKKITGSVWGKAG